jgi:uracil-DNA glycosylase
MISVDNYRYLSWSEKYPDGNVVLEPDINSSWLTLFSQLTSDPRFLGIEARLSELVKKGTKIYPYPDLVFSAFKFCTLNNLKVVIVGQDPYFKAENGIPQAMGLSFSVPIGITIPSSLYNIYKNLIKFEHLTAMPEHGNLEFLAYQGCLFLNTSLTVSDGEKNSHAQVWKWFTDEIIRLISSETKNMIFVLWGAPALEKIKLIDMSKHEAIISSHPSGLSFDRPLKEHPPFRDKDHFTEINKLLEKYGKHPLILGL